MRGFWVFFPKYHYEFQRFAIHHQDHDLLARQSTFSEGLLVEDLRDSTFKIVCLFLLFLDFYLLFGKTKLFLDISGNENKGYRCSKK